MTTQGHQFSETLVLEMGNIIKIAKVLQMIASGDTVLWVRGGIYKQLNKDKKKPVALSAVIQISHLVIDTGYSRLLHVLNENKKQFNNKHGHDAYDDIYRCLRTDPEMLSVTLAAAKLYEREYIGHLCADTLDLLQKYDTTHDEYTSMDKSVFSTFELYLRALDTRLHISTQEFMVRCGEWVQSAELELGRHDIEFAMIKRVVCFTLETPAVCVEDVLTRMHACMYKHKIQGMSRQFDHSNCLSKQRRFFCIIRARMAVHGLTYDNIYDTVRYLVLKTNSHKDAFSSELRQCRISNDLDHRDRLLLQYALRFLLDESFMDSNASCVELVEALRSYMCTVPVLSIVAAAHLG